MNYSMVPQLLGPEKYDVSETTGVIAYEGTRFDTDNPQHRYGTDAVRYAIRLQQLREARDYVTLDLGRAWLSSMFYVMQEREGTRLLGKPPDWGKHSRRERELLKPYIRMPVRDGILYDAELLRT